MSFSQKVNMVKFGTALKIVNCVEYKKIQKQEPQLQS